MNIAQIICTPTVKNDKKLKRISEPLLQGFNLDVFWKYTITAEGELTYVCNHALSAEYFYSNGLFKGHPYFKNPHFLKSGFFFADKTTSKDYIQTQGKLHDSVSLNQIFMIMNVNEEKAEGYGFATTHLLPDLTNAIINNIYLFKKFISYFETEAEDILKQVKKHSADIKAMCPESFNTETSYFDKLDSTSNPEKLLKLIEPARYEVLLSLTRREKDCLRWFLKGMSAVQIGKKIHLSHRTVESYMENIKNKFGCNTKQELFDAIINSKEFLLLTFF